MPGSTPVAASPRGARRRAGWFVLLWASGVLALVAVALPLRWLLRAP